MGANATTFVPTYVASEVLTAADLNVTNSGIPVFATTTTRDNSFGGTGEKVLAEGQFAYIEATNTTQYYDGAAWQTLGGGLTYITQATPSAVASVSINNCFSSAYDNYFITFTTSASVGTNSGLSMRFRASATDTTTNYASQRINYYSSTVATTPNPDGTDEFSLGFVNSANATSYGLGMRIFQPNVAAATRALWEAFSIENVGTINGFISSGYQNSTTQFDGFTITTSGTSITGTIRVYGLQNS